MRRWTLNLACLTFFLVACSPASPAPPSGPLLVYTAREESQVPALVDLFRAQHPEIDIRVVRESSGAAVARLLAEKANPKADAVWAMSATALLLLEQADVLEGYAPAGIERVSPEFRDPATPPRWVGINVFEAAFCVNPAELKKLDSRVPRGWEDLIRPEYRGSVVMPHPASSGTGFLMVSHFVRYLGEEQAWHFLDELHRNVAFYTHSGSKPCTLAVAGDYPIGLTYASVGLPHVQRGAPIELIWPKEKSAWDVEANALVKKPNTHPAARTFMDWSISDAAMTEYAKNNPITSVPSDRPLPPGYISEPRNQLAANDYNWASANRSRILRKWIERYDAKSEPSP